MPLRLGRHPVGGPIAAALLAVTLLVGVVSVAWHESDQTIRRQAQQQLRSNSDAAARALVRESDDHKRGVEAMATSRLLVAALKTPSRSTLDAVHRELSTLAHSQDAPAVFLADLRGRILDSHPVQPELIGVDFSYRDWFRGAVRTGVPYVSEAYRSVATGHPLVVGVATPVADGARRLGYLTVLWQLDSVRAVAEGARRDDGVSVTVTDQAGQELTGSLAVDNRGQVQRSDIPDEVRQALAGRTLSTVRDGAVLVSRPVPGIGWTVTVTRPTSLAFAPAATFRESLLLTLGLALLLVLVFTTLAVRVARRRAAERGVAEDERKRLTTLFAASPIGIIEGLPDGTILAVNDALAHMLGYDVPELLAMKAELLAFPDSEPAISESLQRVSDGSLSNYTAERLYRHRDGSEVPVLVSVVVLRDRAGKLRRMVAFVVDQRAQKASADELRALAETLAEREAFLATLLDAMDVSVLACDDQGVPTLVNRQVRAMHGVPSDTPVSALGQLHLAHVDGRPMSQAESPLVRALAEGEVRDAELLVLPQDGRPPVRMLAQARRLTGLRGQTTGAVVAAHDVTAMRATEAALRASEDRFRRAFDEGLTGMVMVDPAGDIVRVNATMARMVDRTPAALVGHPFGSCFDDLADRQRVVALLAAGEGELRAELAMKARDGRRLWALVSMVWLTVEEGQRVLLAQVEDVTGRREAEERLMELALHDELTGLPNRRLLLERCEHAFATARSGRLGTSVAALFIDLDGFKLVNDRAGHDVGDQLLADVAHDLQSTLRPTDTVARVGGDEFVVLVEQDDGLAYLRTVADRIGTTVRRQVMVAGSTIAVSASVGIARVDLALEPEVGPEQLLRRADAAMYRAKGQGRDRHDVFDVDLQDRIEARHELEHAVREALVDDRVSLVFQPVMDVDSGIVVGAEALVRLTNAQGRPLPTLPSVIAAEGAGLVEVLGDRVLHLALAAARTWPVHMTVAVNVSARELTGRDLRSRVENALLRHDFDPSRLVLEITESSILSAGSSAVAELERLRSRGVRVAIDDFGTAYATLQNLTTLPVDALKVDASFTAGIPTQRIHSAVVHGVASMAYELDIPCIVEGVETEAQLAAIRGLSVQAQGWFWGRPRGSQYVPAATAGVLPQPREELPGTYLP